MVRARSFSEVWIIFIHENAFENVVCQNGGHFFHGAREDELTYLEPRSDQDDDGIVAAESIEVVFYR